MSLDPSADEMRRLSHLAADRLVDHRTTSAERRVHHRPSAATLGDVVGEVFPHTGTGIEDSLARFFDELLPRATFVDHPRFFAYVPGPGSFAGALGAWLAAATNLFVGSWQSGATFALLEQQVLDWMRTALGLPAELRHGLLTTGGSMANLCAIATARHRLRTGGRFRVHVGAEAHYSLAKAARVLGVADEDIVPIATGDDQRVHVDALERVLAADRRRGLGPGMVCVTAGTTSTGAVDPIVECREVCERFGAWLHVDGAYGAAMALLDEAAELRAALACADSLTLDPHKWLYVPFEAGCLLTRDAEALRGAFGGDAAYLQDVPRDAINFFELGPELTRGARALPLWMLFRSVGFDRIAAAIRGDVARCRRAHDELATDPRFEIVTPPQMSVFSFALREGETATRELLARILDDGTTMLSSTRVGGRFALRWCVVNHRTTDADIDRAVARVRELAGPD